MKKAIIIIAVILCSVSYSQTKIMNRDSNGKVTSTETKNGSKIVTRDSNGKITETKSFSGNKIITRDPQGKIKSTKQKEKK